MSNVIISVENLGKKYKIRHQQEQQRYVALRDVVANKLLAPWRWLQEWQGTKRKEPRVNTSGNNTSLLTPNTLPHAFIPLPAQEDFWALRDVSFEVKQGEVIGIIGRNGAGKSTLLKVLSRITEPSEGRIRMRGRVASLLEVGTGFHPELSGRENIYLNGAVLGMARAEIRKKFDEIIAFAEIEKFLDTPVKRYSSGMYMRLAFSVAAHLEPEILVVDEVLAVGDSTFQKKCLGKMEEVAKGGRTVLFVSHNMQAILRLTGHSILLVDGRVAFKGETRHAIEVYNDDSRLRATTKATFEAKGDASHDQLIWAQVKTSRADGTHCWGEPVIFEFVLRINAPTNSLFFSFQVMDAGRPICHFWYADPQSPNNLLIRVEKPGLLRLTCSVPKFRLYQGKYDITTWLSDRRSTQRIETLSGICPFEVGMGDYIRQEYDWQPGACTYLEDDIEWKGEIANSY